MSGISKKNASQVFEYPGYKGWFDDREMGGFTVGFETYGEGVKLNHLLKGLPDDCCQSRHWIYVIKGRFGVRYQGREEIYEEGEAFYVPAGHTGIYFPDTELVHFSPTPELQKSAAVFAKNIKAELEG